VIILIFRKGNFGVVVGEPIEEGELLCFVKMPNMAASPGCSLKGRSMSSSAGIPE
jgi:hypothetical protein